MAGWAVTETSDFWNRRVTLQGYLTKGESISLIFQPGFSRETVTMRWDFVSGCDCLVIKLSGNTLANERLLAKSLLMHHLCSPKPRVIVDLSDLNEQGGGYVLGILNMIRKEVAILGGQMKLCGLAPKLYLFFRDNRLLEIFETKRTLGQAKSSFRKRFHENRHRRDTEGDLPA
jgi:anti-anti-sigma regulatory factor